MTIEQAFSVFATAISIGLIVCVGLFLGWAYCLFLDIVRLIRRKKDRLRRDEIPGSTKE